MNPDAEREICLNLMMTLHQAYPEAQLNLVRDLDATNVLHNPLVPQPGVPFRELYGLYHLLARRSVVSLTTPTSLFFNNIRCNADDVAEVAAIFGSSRRTLLEELKRMSEAQNNDPNLQVLQAIEQVNPVAVSLNFKYSRTFESF